MKFRNDFTRCSSFEGGKGWDRQGEGEGGRGEGRKPPDVQVNVTYASIVKTVNVFRGDLVFTYTVVAVGLSPRAT